MHEDEPEVDEDNKPVPTAEERALTIDTFADRIITGDKHTLARVGLHNPTSAPHELDF